MIEEKSETDMVIKATVVSGREKIKKIEARVMMLDKIVFAFNITFFSLLTI